MMLLFGAPVVFMRVVIPAFSKIFYGKKERKAR